MLDHVKADCLLVRPAPRFGRVGVTLIARNVFGGDYMMESLHQLRPRHRLKLYCYGDALLANCGLFFEITPWATIGARNQALLSVSS